MSYHQDGCAVRKDKIINKEQAAAIAIFQELGWDQATPDQALTLPLGSKEQQQVAKKGLSHSRLPDSMLTNEILRLFAIRLGVNPRRVLRWWAVSRPQILAAAIKEQSVEWATEFVDRACRSEFRGWENAVSRHGQEAVDVVTHMNLPVPQSVEYIKDWAAVMAGHLTDTKVELLGPQVTAKDDLFPRFLEHLQIAITLGAPASGPLGHVLPGAMDNGWLDRDAALPLAMDGIVFATRPIDRKVWTRLALNDLAATDNELLAYKDALIPVISTTEPAMVEMLGLRLLPLLTGEAWAELVEVMLYASTAKALVAVLKAVSATPVPGPGVVERLIPQLSALTLHKNDTVVALSTALLDSWGQGAVSVGAPANDLVYEWQAFPPFQDAPRVHLPEAATPESISSLLASFPIDIHDTCLEQELMWAQLVELSSSDIDAARRSVAGVRNYPILRQWSRGLAVSDLTIYEGLPPYPINPISARNADVLQALGVKPLPCLLSQPSFEDLSLDPEDLLQRLHRFVAEDAEVIVSDLLLALARLRVPADPGTLTERFRTIDLAIAGTTDTVGKVIAGYLTDPFVDPGCFVKYGYNSPGALTIPESVAELVALEDTRFHNWAKFFHNPAILPHFTSSVWAYVTEDPIFLGQVARAGAPLKPVAATEFLCLGLETEEYAAALAQAWRRGVITTGGWQFQKDEIDTNLAEKTRSLRLAAEVGALAAAWSLMDNILTHHAAKTRVGAGVVDMALLAKEFAPSVAAALSQGKATASDVPIVGLVSLAERGGSSKAVRAATEALALLPQELVVAAGNSPKEQHLLGEEEFKGLWPMRGDLRNNPEDGYAITMSLVAGHTQDMEVLTTLTKDSSSYFVNPSGWFYSLDNEGQVRATTADEQVVWLHWDKATRTLLPTEHRDWVNKRDAPLGNNATDLSVSLVAVVIASLQRSFGYDNCARGLKDLITEGSITAPSVQKVVRALLDCPDYNPTKSFSMIEKNPKVVHVLWPILTETLGFAAASATPPRWTTRCLDAISAHTQLLRKATHEGLIPAAAWQPLATLEAAKKKSAARAKAQGLAEVFLAG